MKTRGRPRHPDILTPRQWEVLEYLQRGLTNEEIAQRMGITLDGAKFHVSEILGRLGLASRYEAASWRPEPQPTRRRWAFAFAPFALIRKLKLSAVATALAGIVAVGVAAGIALLVWGLVATQGRRATPRTGVTALDGVLALIERQDAAALARLARFNPVPCLRAGPSGAILCPNGVAVGTLLPNFPIVSCEASSATTMSAVRAAFENVFAKSNASSIYAVGRASLVKNGDLDYVAVVTPGAQPSPTAPATMWYISADGKIDQLLYECGGPQGAAIDIETLGLAGTGFALAPQASCPAARVAIDMVVDSTLGAGGDGPRLLGSVLAADGTPTAERVIVELPANLRLTGMSDLSSVTGGTRLHVNGSRTQACFVRAGAVSPLAPAAR